MRTSHRLRLRGAASVRGEGGLELWDNPQRAELRHLNNGISTVVGTLQRVPDVPVARFDLTSEVYLTTQAGGWWLDGIKDQAAGHQFVIRQLFHNGNRVVGHACLSHRHTGLLLLRKKPMGSVLSIYRRLWLESREANLSVADYCLYLLLVRLQTLDAQRATLKWSQVRSLSNIGLDPDGTIEQWLGTEANERAGSAFVKIKLTPP